MIEVRGYILRGYLGASAGQNAEALTDDGFFRTGDLGQLTAQGRLVFAGRTTEMVNRAAWRAAMPAHLERLAARDMEYFHLYAFNLPRQLGANFEMLGTYLDWLGAHGQAGLAEIASAARRIAAGIPSPGSCPGHGPHGQRKVHNPCCHHR